MIVPEKLAVLFVCMGNICRSPLAEAAFRAAVERLNLDAVIDSAGTGGWHAGEPPDRRAQSIARRYGLEISSYRARQVTRDDFSRFTHIVAMDRQNLATLQKMQPSGNTAQLSLLLDHAEGRKGRDVADPYYGDLSDFETTWRDVTLGANALAERLAAKR